MSETKINASIAEKVKPTRINTQNSSAPDITGIALGDFHVDSKMEVPSGEADIYLCSGTGQYAGKRFILKYYRRKDAVKPEVIEKLQHLQSPCVAPIVRFGEYEGHQYAVLPYYSNPSLAEVLAGGDRFSDKELRSFIIPSVIEGLKALHDAGILHKDIKPGNLIPDDSCKHVVLIDFGLSSDAGKNTILVTRTGMTPAYAAPEAVQGVFHRESDYYALGITVFELFTGFTPFQNPGFSPEETARLAAISKIDFPQNFPEDLKKLVLGLTYKDLSYRNEKNNPNRRWGYDEVKKWLRGEVVPVPGKYDPTSGIQAFLPYSFCGKTCTSETELLRMMLKAPEAAIKDLGRGILPHYYDAFSKKKGDLCRDTETKLGNNLSENRRHLFALIYRLNPDIRDIPFNDEIIEGIQELGRTFVDAGVREATENGGLRCGNTKFTQPVRDFVLSGIPEDYAAIVLKNTSMSRLFENFRKLWNQEGRTDSDTELTLILGYSISCDQRILVHGRVYESPEAFCREMKELSQRDRKAYMELIGTAREDLDFLEHRLPDAPSRDFISKAREEFMWAVFGNDEYHFRNGEDFRSYIEKLVREEKPYELMSLWNRYKVPIKEFSENVWNIDFQAQIEKIISGFIRVGEHLFTGEKPFREFITGVISRGKKDPAFLLAFIEAHKNSLDCAVEAFPGISACISELYAAGDAVIVLDEQMFFGTDSFREFIDDVMLRGKEDPGYLAGFVKRHHEALKQLENSNTVQKILDPLNAAFRNLILFDGRVFTAVSDFEKYIAGIIKKGETEPRFLVAFSEDHRQEISDLRKRDSRCQEALFGLRTARNRIVAFDEYVFPSLTDFQSFTENVIKTGQKDPAYLRRFVRVHKKALNDLIGVSTTSPVVKRLLDAANGVIGLDEYVFNDASGFENFRSVLAGNDDKEIMRVSDFVREHQETVIRLKADMVAASSMNALLDTAKSCLKQAVINVNGVKYFSVLKKGDFVEFGNYFREDKGEKRPIDWQVLEVSGNEALLISRYGLDCKQYHSGGRIIWGNCDLRGWLNNDFLKTAFSEEELKRIKVSELSNDANPEYHTRGGNSTKDRVFCLSIAEAEQYFEDDIARQCRPTDYAQAQGAGVCDSNGWCWWWLRSPGHDQKYASRVNADGVIRPNGRGVHFDRNAVRPAIRIIWNH